MNIYSFTYIIGYRHSQDKFNNLKRVLDWINGFANVEVILVEQDKISKISHLPLKCKHIFLKTDKPFNKAWGYNVGIKYSNSNIIGFGDAETIVNPIKLIENIKLLDKYEMVSTHNSIIDLAPNENNILFEDLVKIDRLGKSNSICDGICFFRKSSIIKIGCWSESFVGYGGVEDFQSHKTKNFITNYQSDDSAKRFFHNKNENNPINSQILNKLVTMSKEDLVKTINISTQKIGMNNLYEY
jgi:hypothetical protein